LPDNVTCPRRGKDNPAGAKFCLECGTALSDAVRPREERKLLLGIHDARRLIAGDRPAAAHVQLDRATAFWESAGAVRYIEEAELIASSLKAGAPNAKTTARR
jgi:hypothetical protein